MRAAATTLLLATCLAMPVLANPQKSSGIATGCWGTGGVIRKVKIGHAPWKPCAVNEQQLQFPLWDIPNQHERRLFVTLPRDGQEYVVLDFEGFIVGASCHPPSDPGSTTTSACSYTATDSIPAGLATSTVTAAATVLGNNA
jgi:hypothetical protein